MTKVRYLLRNINVVNILLTGILVFFVIYLLFPKINMGITYNIPQIKKEASESSDAEKKTPEGKTPSHADYIVIAEQNLFHPERKIPVEKKAEQPLPKPDFVLYGTLITDELQVAYMEDKKVPQTTPGRGKRQTAVSIGDVISGFTLKEVDADRVVMLRGEEKLVVQLNDPQKPKTREGVSAAAPAASAPTVISTGQPPAATGRQAIPSQRQQQRKETTAVSSSSGAANADASAERKAFRRQQKNGNDKSKK